MLFENFQRARLQLVRIKTDQETFMDELKNPKDTEVRIQAGVAMFSDVHYLSICLNKIRELLDVLRQLHSNKNLREIMRNYGQLFRESNEFTNNLEHITEQMKSGTIDLGNLIGTKFTFNNKDFEVGDSRANEIEQLIQDIIGAL